MIPVYHYFAFNGKSSRDFEVWISGGGTFGAPERDVKMQSVPGRNGTLTIDNGRFENIKITYPAFITKAFRHNFDSFKAFLCAQRGYKRLSDTYHPEFYRLAAYSAALNPDMKTLNRSGEFDIVFNCDPRRFLKSGEKTITLTAAGTIKNPTYYPAKPLIRCYGTGSVTVNGIKITITTANGYTDLNCETENAYKDTAANNCNGNITFGDVYKTFPALQPGENEILFSGLTKVEIIPNFWTV